MGQHSNMYDHPQYLVHQQLSFAAPAAGSAAVTSKFVAFANLNVYSITSNMITSGGTSTYTLWNGTATVTAIGAQTFAVVRVFNTATAGAAPAMGTATYGPYVASLYNGTATATQTNSTATFLNNTVQLYDTSSTGTGARQAGTNSGNGGFPCNQGDLLYVVQGTEGTAVCAYCLDFSVQALASVSN